MQNMKELSMSMVLWLFLVSLTSVLCVNPGLRVRISQSGLDYAGKQATASLSAKVVGQSLPEYSGEAHVTIGKVEYKFSNLKIVSFTAPSSSISVVPGVGITWSLTGAAISLHGDWWYKYRLGPISHHSDGDFDASASGINLSLTVGLGVQAGKPTIFTVKCTDSVGDVSVKFHGGDSWLINIFDDKIEDALKDKLQDIMCDAASKAVNNDAAEKLATLDLIEDLGDQMALNYSLVAPPLFGNGYLDSQHRAEVFWINDTTSSSVTPRPLPGSSDTTHMVAFWLSDYLLDTAGDVLNRHGILKYNLTTKDLDKEHAGYLNTTCTSGQTDFCIGQMIPQLGKKYPNATVMLQMVAGDSPNMTFSNQTIGGAFNGIVRYFVVTNEQKVIYALDTYMTFSLQMETKLTGTNLTAQITSHKITINVTKMSPEFGPIPPTLNQRINFFFDQTALIFIQKSLNEKGAKGFSLPKIHNAAYVNPELKVIDGALLVMTDIKYVPSNQAINEGTNDNQNKGNKSKWRNGENFAEIKEL